MPGLVQSWHWPLHPLLLSLTEKEGRFCIRMRSNLPSPVQGISLPTSFLPQYNAVYQVPPAGD